MKYLWILLGILMFSSPVIADSLYQADVGGYSTGVGVGLGFGLGTSNLPYTAQSNISAYSGYSAGTVSSNIPYDSFTYPYGSRCCGCNQCSNCETGYANGPR